MTELRSHLVVTADASAIVGEARKAVAGMEGMGRAAAGARRDLAGLAEEGGRAAASAAVFSQAMDRQEQSFERLLGALDPGLRAMEEFEEAQKAIAAAVLTGAAAETEGARALDLLTQRYDAFTAAQARARPASGSARQSASVFEGVALYEDMLAERAAADRRAFQLIEESLNPATRAAREFAEARAAITRAQASGAVANDRAARALQQLTAQEQDHARSQSAAAQSAAAMERAIEEETRAYHALRLSLDPVARAMEEVERERQQLTRAVRLGIASEAEAARSLALLEQRHQQVATGVTRTGMAMQNAAFQVTDAIVQYQGGQAVGLIAAQQLPQLLGGFGALGAGLGVLAALGAPVISMWLANGEAVRTLDQNLDALDQRIGAVKDRLALLRDENPGGTFGSMAGDVREMTALMLELDRAAQLKTLRQTLDTLLREKIDATVWDEVGQALTGSRGAPALNRDQLTRRNFERLTEGRGLTYDQFDERRSEIDALAKAGEAARVTAEIKRLMTDMAAGGPVTDINGDLMEMLLTLGKVAVQTAAIEAEFNGTAEAARLWVGVVEGASAIWDRAVAAGSALKAEGEERLRIAQNELSLAQVIASHGEDSREAEAERARIARENYSVELDRAGIYGEQRDRLIEIHDQHAGVISATDSWASAMAGVRGEVEGILAAIASLGGGLVARAAKNAELAALNAGGTIADAASAGREARRDAEYRARTAGAGFGGRMVAGVQRWWERGTDRLDAEIAEARDTARLRDRGSRGGAGGGGGAGLGAVSSIKDELARLKPSYAADVEAAEAWRDKALASLKKAQEGYATFAADVETIFQERMAKAYEADLKRRDDWQSGVQRALIEINKDQLSWADVSENIVTKWSSGMEDAFVAMGRTGKFEVGSLVDYVQEQFARLAFQQVIQPGLNSIFGAITGALGIGGPSAAGASAASISTNHTGSPGVQRTYALGRAGGDRMRPDERLTMMRRGEEIMTARALENAGALISAMTAVAASAQPAGQAGSTIVIQPMNNSSVPLQMEVEERTDERGRQHYVMAVSDAVATGLRAPGGKARRTLKADFGIGRTGSVQR